MNIFRKYALWVLVLTMVILNSGCMGAPPDKTAIKFLENCQKGEWSSAEGALSQTGRMHFEQTQPLEKSLWPVLGLAASTGVPVDLIKAKLPFALILVSSDISSATRGSVRVKINNSQLVDPDIARKVLESARLSSIDFVVRIDLIQESNRWKIEKIVPQVTVEEQTRLDELAKTSPGSL
jgi:hypothetical protein